MDLNKKCYFLITGASKGIGNCIAIETCKKLKSGSLAVLIARSGQNLEKTKNEILSINNKITVKTFAIDLSESTETTFENTIITSLMNFKIKDFELAFIIHNAGSVGDVSKKAKEIFDISQMTKYYHLNVFSVISLNSIFMKHFESIPKLVINITSKCGIVPFKSMSYYCSGKAAREMYFKVLAEEESDNGTIILNYSPGPVDTDMVAEVQEKTIDDGLRNYFKEQRETRNILTPIQTTTKLLTILRDFKFKSGDHVDYYD